MSDDQSGASDPQGGGVLDGLLSMGGDLVGDVGKDLIGVGDLETVVNAGHAIADLGEAAYHGIVGDTTTAGHDLGNAVADGFNAVPFNDVAWDGMMTLGRAIDGDGNHDPMWGQGGEDAFRDAVGGTPVPNSSSPSINPSDDTVAQADTSQGGDPGAGDWSGDASQDDPSQAYGDQPGAEEA
ncbi:MAG TPA: hypothetical protein VGZ32_07925 [Actinocrinis sp.]|jgi:hypothetical protein|uniref:hypothetical protein n=1 Tax=Actinocrinis sp. TaxID=1920516 RepID=UPI002DDD2398|nr:hypothetical protein [Actinocrinis sp.]HEV3170251.1 hypothetical protein [Actinocrinis sp.]